MLLKPTDHTKCFYHIFSYILSRKPFMRYLKGKETGMKEMNLDRKHLSLVMRKQDFCIFENKDADQLRGNREADQHLCFRYTDSTIPLLPKYEISSL